MAGRTNRLLYRHADVLLIRATTCPDWLTFPADPHLDGAPEEVLARASEWLQQVWRIDAFRRAVEVASPVLSVAVREAAAGRLTDARQARRLVHSVASYLLRWQGRPTPFGLFAGVAAARIGGDPKARWGSDHRIVVRPDAEWTGAVVDRLEHFPDLLPRLPVVANDCAFPRGDRLVVPGRAAGSRPGELAPSEVTIRRTGPVRSALDLARNPLLYARLAKLLTAEYPQASAARIDALLTRLVAEGFLLTSLRAPMTVPDSLGHLCAELAAADVDELPSVDGTVRELHALQTAMARHNQTASPAEVVMIRTTTAERMAALSGATAQPLAADTALDCDITVPEAVIREAETAASVLLRLTPYPFGHPRWKDFHGRFRQHYGVGAAVPVADLVADSGLGLPADYLGSALRTPPRPLTSRDETLLALIQQAAFDGAEEIVLTEATIRALTVGDPTEILPPPRAELAFQLHAESDDALRRGAFRLLVTGVPRVASSMAGRFAEVLPEADRRRLSSAYAAVNTDDPGTVAAQLSFTPRRRRSENVARVPQLLPLTIPLAEHRDPEHGDLIALDDLAVSADARRFRLVQLSTGRDIEPRVLHALEAGTATPLLARFLAEITTARCAGYQAFDWGAAARLPYLPRLRHGRTILSPARWLLSAAELVPRTASASVWDAALTTWRSRLRVPPAVVLCEVDLRLPLDLDRPLHRALLRSRLDRTGGIELREAPSSADLAWVGRAHEFLLPLRRARPENAGGLLTTPSPVRRDAEHLPGASPWLHVRVHGHPDRQNDILTGYLPRLFAAWDEPPLWWFTRHRDAARPDSAQHLALHVRLPSPGHYGAAAGRVGAWAAELRGDGLAPGIELVGHRPQTGRYGHGTAMTSAESMFAADSTAALAQIELAMRTGIPAEAVTAAGFVDLASSYAETTEEGLRRLITELPQKQGRLDTALRDATFRLADPYGGWAALRSQPGGEAVLTAWEQRRTALADYREQLALQRDDPFSVLRSLLHLHHVRALAVDPERERVTNRLARAVALRLIARNSGTSS
jgi:thiopeptide-type bacteriocin biosynthesis protein